VLVLVFAVVDLQRYRPPESCINQCFDKPSCCGCVCNKCEQGEHEAVTLLFLVSSSSSPTYRVKTQDLKHYVSHHWPVSAVTKQLDLCFLYCFSGLSALLLLTYVVGCKIWSCHELDCMQYLPHTGSITANFLHICVIFIASLLIFQALISMAVCYGKCLTAVPIRHTVRLFQF